MMTRRLYVIEQRVKGTPQWSPRRNEPVALGPEVAERHLEETRLHLLGDGLELRIAVYKLEAANPRRPITKLQDDAFEEQYLWGV